MKRLFTLLLLVTAGNLFAQTAKVDTTLTEKWNGSTWVNDSKVINTYDANCLLTTSLLQEWDGGSSTWVNSILFTNTYGSSNELTQQLGQSWDAGSSSWVDATRNTYAYDGSQKLITLTFEAWFITWTTLSQTTYSYNGNNQLDSALTQSLLGVPTNSALETYFYNGDGTLHQNLFQSWVSNAWVDQFRLTYTYDASSRVSTILKEVPAGSTWENSYLTTNTYDGNSYLTTALEQTWDGTTWVDDFRETYYYTTGCTTLPLKLISFTATRNKNIVTLNWQTADEINTSHFNIQRSVDGVNFSNVGNINAKGNGGQSYNFSDNIDNITKDKVYYRLQMMDKDGRYSFSKIIPLTLEIFAGNIKTYPNPVKDQLYILFNAQNATKATIRISDASGKIVHTETVSTAANAINVNVSRLGKGVYYVKLITDKGVQRTTFMKQ